MGGKSSPPPAPDYTGAAKAQGAANVDTAIAEGVMNRPITVTPYGTSRWTQVGSFTTPGGYKVPQWQQTTELTPLGQSAFNAQQRATDSLYAIGESGLGAVRNTMGTQFRPQGIPDQRFSWNAPDSQGALDTSSLARMPVNAGTTAQDAILSRLNPSLERQRAQLEQQLANQGIAQGSEAYRTAQVEQSQRENDLRTQAALHGIQVDMGARQQGLNEQQTLGNFANAANAQNFAQRQAQAGFLNAQRQAALQEQLALRNQPLNELNALFSSQQVNVPQFSGAPATNIAPPPIFSATQAQGQADMNAYNARMAQQGQMMSGLFSLGGSALMAGGMNPGGMAGVFGFGK